jgi:hypothetical protein
MDVSLQGWGQSELTPIMHQFIWMVIGFFFHWVLVPN